MTQPLEKKSCLNCPNYLNPTEATVHFGKSMGASACALFGYLLSRPGATPAQDEGTAHAFAENCKEYGTMRAFSAPSDPHFEVVLPNPDSRVELTDLDPKKTVVRSCNQCVHLIEDQHVQQKIGWPAGMCSAKGRLIFANRRATEARNCSFRQRGTKTDDLSWAQLLPNYVLVERAETIKLARAAADAIEPLEYPTDRVVTDEEAASGIQAWRKVVDPDNVESFVMLPIFDPKSFTEEERELIPLTGSQEHPELYRDHNGARYTIATLWMEMDEVPSIWGQPGVGKTEIGRHLAWLMQVPFYRFSIKESTELYELEGAKEFDPEKGTYFRDGRFTTAWRSRCVIVVDEPNMGRPDVWAFLRPCMDNSKQLVLDSDAGRHVPRHEFAFLMLAMNPAWSPLNVGTNPIGAADASRLMHLDFDLPEPSIEREIIRSRIMLDGWLIDDARLDLVMGASVNIRDLVNNGTLSMGWGVRETLKVSRALRWFDPIRAFRLAAASYLEPEQREAMLDQVRAVSGGKLPRVQILAEDDALDGDEEL